MSDDTISAVDSHPRKRVALEGTEISYVDIGDGPPVVFLHGNPTSSYLWRNVIPHLSGSARCLAPDLVGMGDSDKAPGGAYRFVDHRRYLDAWFESVDLGDRVTLVVHDWGSALGFHWAHRNQERVNGLAYMEALVRPLTWDAWPAAARELFQGLRSPAGDEMILEHNMFVEFILPAGMLRDPSDEEMSVYRRPYTEPGESRRPTLIWPREIPFEGEPADVAELVGEYSRWLAGSNVPKLFINGEPGSILTGPQREFCRAWPNQQEVTVPGLHYLQEDSPAAIGQAIAQWHASL